MKNSLIIFILAIVIFSCTKEVDLDVPVVESYITMDARISAGDSIKILVGTSSSILDDREPEAGNLSRVFLYENDSLVDSLEPRPYGLHMPGIYLYHSGYLPRAGQRYQLVATRQDYDTAYGSDLCPGPVKLENLRIDTLTRSISFRIVDEAPEHDFYMMEVFREHIPGSKSSMTNITTYDPSIMMLYSNGSLEDGGSSGRRAVLSDEHFNGGHRNLEIFYDTTLTTGQPYIFQISRITNDYFLHEQSRSVERNTELQIFSDRANLYSNVMNGYGVVACKNTVRTFFYP